MIYNFKIRLQSKQIKLIMHQVYFKCIGNARKILIHFGGFKTTLDFFCIDLDFIRCSLKIIFNRKLK